MIMENKKIEKVDFHKERSLQRCIWDAWLGFALQPFSYIKFLAPAMLVCSVSIAIFIWTIGEFSNSYLIPFKIFHSQREIPYKELLLVMGPSILEYIWILLACLVLFLGCVIFQSACLTQIDYTKKEGQIPTQNIFAFYPSFYQKFIRSLKYFSIQVTILVLGIGLIALLALFSKWMWLLLPIIWIYWSVACEIGSLNYVLTETSLHRTILYCFHPQNAFGKSFVLLLITSIFIAILFVVGLYPNLLILLSYSYDTLGVLAYDASGMPFYMPLLSFFCTVVGSLFVLIGLSVQKLALTFLWSCSKKNG